MLSAQWAEQEPWAAFLGIALFRKALEGRKGAEVGQKKKGVRKELARLGLLICVLDNQPLLCEPGP